MITSMLVLFWISAALCLTLCSYPLVAWLRSRLGKKPQRITGNFSQPVSIIVACYNEEAYIGQKILSLIDPEEWIEGSELFIVTSGSTDRTNEIAEKFLDRPGVHLLTAEERATKIENVNRAVTKCRHEILVFSDCRQVMKKGSIRKLVQRFEDPTVGTVSCTLVDGKEKENGSFFRRLLNAIAFSESDGSSSLNVFGALYAQRRSVFRTIPTDILFDDLFVVVSTIAQGKRLVQEKEAVIRDVEFNHYYTRERLERLTRGLLVFLYRHFALIRELPATTFCRFLVYKYMKLLLPLLLLLLLISSAVLVLEFLPLYYFPVLLLPFALLLLFRKTRNYLLLITRINYFFFLAGFKFVFFNERAITWQKLQVNKPL